MTFRTLLIVGIGSAALIAQEGQTFAGDNHQPGRGAAIASGILQGIAQGLNGGQPQPGFSPQPTCPGGGCPGSFPNPGMGYPYPPVGGGYPPYPPRPTYPPYPTYPGGFNRPGPCYGP